MRMQVSKNALLLLSVFVGFQGGAFAAVPGHSSGHTQTALVRDAKLVYAEELVRFAQAPYEQPDLWPRHMPSNIDAFAASNKTVLGMQSKECVRSATPGYAPSGCDGQWLMVFELGSLPAVGETLRISDERILAAGLFYGDRHAGARSGCLGYPTKGTLKVTERSESGVKIRFDLEFNLLQHARYPAECGQKQVNGDFAFDETSTNDISTGGLDKLFE